MNFREYLDSLSNLNESFGSNDTTEKLKKILSDLSKYNFKPSNDFASIYIAPNEDNEDYTSYRAVYRNDTKDTVVLELRNPKNDIPNILSEDDLDIRLKQNSQMLNVYMVINKKQFDYTHIQEHANQTDTIGSICKILVNAHEFILKMPHTCRDFLVADLRNTKN